MAPLVIQKALLYGRRRVRRLVIPWCTYTDSEVAHVGLRVDDAHEKGYDATTITTAFAEVDRAVLDDEADGFVRVHYERGRLLGCTIVASHAGDMIGDVAYALTHAGRLADLSWTIHPYPTQADALPIAGDTISAIGAHGGGRGNGCSAISVGHGSSGFTNPGHATSRAFTRKGIGP
jgi:pyruvate/2-oxoglutarate dehydrogenase complex dihydrolipoamide dehydrogenase (E3) component